MNVKPFSLLGDDEDNGFNRRNEETETNEVFFVLIFVPSFLRLRTVTFVIPVNYRTVTFTGLNCRLIAVPSGVLATPLT